MVEKGQETWEDVKKATKVEPSPPKQQDKSQSEDGEEEQPNQRKISNADQFDSHSHAQ